MVTVLIPIPDHDFDTTEVAIPWQIFKQNGYEVIFSTEHGKVGQTDPLLLSGVIFGKLGAKPDAVRAYKEMQADVQFNNPIRYDEVCIDEIDCLYLPGGHAKGMRQYLESKTLQDKVVQYFRTGKLVATVCHGPIVLARSVDSETGRSVLYGRKIAALPKILERTAYFISAWKVGKYYRTYPEYVEDEVKRSLKNPKDFQRGSRLSKPFCCEDGNLISGRWPIDSRMIAEAVVKRFTNTM